LFRELSGPVASYKRAIRLLQGKEEKGKNDCRRQGAEKGEEKNQVNMENGTVTGAFHAD